MKKSSLCHCRDHSLPSGVPPQMPAPELEAQMRLAIDIQGRFYHHALFRKERLDQIAFFQGLAITGLEVSGEVPHAALREGHRLVSYICTHGAMSTIMLVCRWHDKANVSECEVMVMIDPALKVLIQFATGSGARNSVWEEED